jgi:hypothetical protein
MQKECIEEWDSSFTEMFDLVLGFIDAVIPNQRNGRNKCIT